MIRLRAYFLILLVFLISGCAQLGIPAADTFNKKVVTAYTTVQAVADAASTAYEADKLDENDRSKIILTLRAAMTSIRAAVAMHDADPAGADTKLAATVAILTAIQTALVSQGKPS